VRAPRVDFLLAIASGLVALVVYLATLNGTVPFWDAGEFIAASYVLGIPHPPGTPLYVLLGRVFCTIPFPVSIAERVNLLSAIPAAVAVGLTYLVTTRLITLLGGSFARGGGEGKTAGHPARLGRFGGLVAAFVTAFSDTFWMNAVEAEVYALSSMVMIGSVYLMLLWRERHHGSPNVARSANNLVVVVFYGLALSVAFHMGTFIVFLPLVLYFLSEHTTRLDSPRFVASSVVLVVLFFFMGFGPEQLGMSALLVTCLVFLNWPLVRGVFAKEIGPRENLFVWLVLLFLLGLSVHAYLPIRANLHPSINEADPSTWKNFWLMLTRDQYKPGPPWELRATWEARLGEQFWRYFRPQYNAGWDLRLGTVSLDFWAFPFVLGLLGAVAQAARSVRAFLLMAFLVLVCSLGLIWHLNFRAEEVRDRDYFFVGLYQFFAVWIGIGAAWLVRFLHDAVPGRAAAPAAALGAGILMLLPIGQIRAGYWKHDRTNDTIARNFAYNMLMPLERDAILFTNGDNDTFPLWYLQEVEGVRKDVRVANLSLLNTDWYVRQLRDEAPTAPISWSDEIIGSLGAVWDERLQRVIEMKDQAVVEILRANHWRRPIYIAVTVPDLMGLDERKQLVNEGIVWRITPEPVGVDADEEKLVRNLGEVYRWGGLLDASGRLDSTLYRDENAVRLAQNYGAAYVRLAQIYEERAREATRAGRRDEALSETRRAILALERGGVFRVGFSLADVVLGSMYVTVGEYGRADSLFTALIGRAERDASATAYVPELHLRRGDVRFDSRDYGGALSDYGEFSKAFPGEWIGWEARARTLAASGRREEALSLLDQWLRGHPGHPLGLEMRKLVEGSAYAEQPAESSKG
jgi:tetratricopeptide (TPR) repeat protein